MSGSSPTPWQTNVLGVLGECNYCIPSVFCPAFAYYSISELFEVPPAGVIESCAGGYCICFGFLIRSRLRNRYNLDGSFIGDLLAHTACHCVALARIWREAKLQVIAEEKRQQQQQQELVQQQQQQQQFQNVQLQSPPFQSFAPYSAPGLIQPQPYMPIAGNTIGLGFYSAPPPIPVQPGLDALHHNQGNSVDTSFSAFEDNQGVTEASSFRREDSLDPPPSNTDTNPWDMLHHRANKHEEPTPFVLPSVQPQQGTEMPTTLAPGGGSSRRPISREDYLKVIANQLEDHNTQIEATEEELGIPSRTADSTQSMTPYSADLNSRLACLRPPNSSALPITKEEDDEAADRIILERDSMMRLRDVEEELLEQNLNRQSKESKTIQ
eukprot:g4127.t1